MTKENAKRLYDHYIGVIDGSKFVNVGATGPQPANEKQKIQAKKNAADILKRHPSLRKNLPQFSKSKQEKEAEAKKKAEAEAEAEAAAQRAQAEAEAEAEKS